MTNFVDIIANVNGASFCAIDVETNVTLTGGKANPLKGRVKKIGTGHNVIIFSNKTINGYDSMVRRRLAAEGKDPESFVLSQRSWGERVPHLPLVRHVKDGVIKYYFEVIFIKSGEVFYTLDNEPIDERDIQGFPTKTPEGDQGGLSDNSKVIIRTFALESIRKIRIDREEYEGPFEVIL